jgi:diacylglycerol kinase family enzyme
MPSFASGRLWYQQSQRFALACEAPQRVQLDGEPAGTAVALEVWVDPKTLPIRVRP